PSMIRWRLLVGISLASLCFGAALGWVGRQAATGSTAQAASPADSPREARAQDPSLGPGLLAVDAFHPDRRPGKDGALPPLPKPAYGGRVLLHAESMPRSLCATIDNNGLTRRILYELHETLLLRDWETTEWGPDLALKYDVQDRLVPK